MKNLNVITKTVKKSIKNTVNTLNTSFYDVYSLFENAFGYKKQLIPIYIKK